MFLEQAIDLSLTFGEVHSIALGKTSPFSTKHWWATHNMETETKNDTFNSFFEFSFLWTAKINYF